MTTKEQILELEKKVKDYRDNTEFVCDTCSARVIGYKGMEKHVIETKHYCYKNLQGGMVGVV